MTRNSVASGYFYPENPDELKKQLKNFFAKVKIKSRKNYGIIAPHAGYLYSGLAAAYSFKNMQKAGTYVILGTNHYNFYNSISTDDFETPLGIVKNDIEFSELLLKDAIFSKDEQKFEHSTEVPLPFMQYLKKNVMKTRRFSACRKSEGFSSIKIVPIAISTKNFKDIIKIAESIIKISRKLKRKIYVIASSDFTHYGYSYEFMPFPANEAKEKLEKLDKEAIGFILKMDSKGFLEYAKKTTICGQGAIAAAIETCKMLGAEKASLLKYSSSAEISKSYDNVVDYASIIFV